MKLNVDFTAASGWLQWLVRRKPCHLATARVRCCSWSVQVLICASNLQKPTKWTKKIRLAHAIRESRIASSARCRRSRCRSSGRWCKDADTCCSVV